MIPHQSNKVSFLSEAPSGKFFIMEASRVTRVSNIFTFTRDGWSKPSMSRNMALHTQHIITKVILASLACPETWPRDTRIERSSMSHMDDVIGMMAYLENILMVVSHGGGIFLKDRVIT